MDERLGEIEQGARRLDSARRSTSLPTSPRLACSSASTPMARCRSIAAMSVPRTNSRRRTGQDADGETAGRRQDGAEAGAPVGQRAVITIGGRPSEPEEDEDDAVKPLPERLVVELTAHRTLALRDAVANNPRRHDGAAAQARRRHLPAHRR